MLTATYHNTDFELLQRLLMRCGMTSAVCTAQQSNAAANGFWMLAFAEPLQNVGLMLLLQVPWFRIFICDLALRLVGWWKQFM